MPIFIACFRCVPDPCWRHGVTLDVRGMGALSAARVTLAQTYVIADLSQRSESAIRARKYGAPPSHPCAQFKQTDAPVSVMFLVQRAALIRSGMVSLSEMTSSTDNQRCHFLQATRYFTNERSRDFKFPSPREKLRVTTPMSKVHLKIVFSNEKYYLEDRKVSRETAGAGKS